MGTSTYRCMEVHMYSQEVAPELPPQNPRCRTKTKPRTNRSKVGFVLL